MRHEDQSGLPIKIGYVWRQSLISDTALFPLGTLIKGHLRAAAEAPILAEISSANGGVLRRSDREITLILTPAQTAALPVGTVVLDLIRDDLSAPEHLHITLRIPVQTSITDAHVRLT